jgi:hypothetical protein
VSDLTTINILGGACQFQIPCIVYATMMTSNEVMHTSCFHYGRFSGGPVGVGNTIISSAKGFACTVTPVMTGGSIGLCSLSGTSVGELIAKRLNIR